LADLPFRQSYEQISPLSGEYNQNRIILVWRNYPTQDAGTLKEFRTFPKGAFNLDISPLLPPFHLQRFVFFHPPYCCQIKMSLFRN
jgi:hypothetical protein